MKTFGKIAWLFVSLIAALSCGIVIGLIHPSEKVNALWIVIAAACFMPFHTGFTPLLSRVNPCP